MYSYYIEECEPEVGLIRDAKAGVLNNAELGFGGRLIVNSDTTDLVVKDLLGQVQSEVKIHLTLAPKLHTDLGLSDDKKVYRFSINLNKKTLAKDFHFSVHLNQKNHEVQLFNGFIQPVELPDKVLLIVGSPRSGTSALGKACRKALKAEAHGESHVIEGVSKALKDTEIFFEDSITAGINGNLVNSVPKTVLLAEHLNMLRNIYKLYYGDIIHLDKTPGIPMLHSLPFAFMAWPNAKVIFCKRRAMENIQSRLIKFPKVNFFQHAKQWKQSFITWRQSRQKITQLLKRNDWFVEVDQYDMAVSAEKVCIELGKFLRLTKSEEKRLLLQLSSTDRPEQTSTLTLKAKSLQDFNWSESQLDELRKCCDKEMIMQNYSYSDTYYLNNDQEETND